MKHKNDYYCDGSGWNGRESKFCVVRPDGVTEIVTYEREEYTNNEMEYEAVETAMELAKEGDTIYTDSRLVVEQINGNYKVRSRKQRPRWKACSKLVDDKKLNVRWIGRDINKAGFVLDELKRR